MKKEQLEELKRLINEIYKKNPEIKKEHGKSKIMNITKRGIREKNIDKSLEIGD